MTGWILLAASGAALVAWWASLPMSPAQARRQVDRYLRQESSQTDFKTELDPQRMIDAAALQNQVERLHFAYRDAAKKLQSLRTNLVELGQEVEALQSASITNDPASSPEAIQTRQATLAAHKKKLAARKRDYNERAARYQELRKKFNTTRDQLSDLGKNGAPSPDALAKSFREQSAAAVDYGTLYRLIGQRLWLSERCWSDTNTVLRRAGLLFVMEALKDAGEGNAEDAWLAARICQGYLLPQIDWLSETNQPAGDLDRALYACAQAFRAAGETNLLSRSLELTIAHASNRRSVDWSRVQLAGIYEAKEKPSAALELLKAVEDPKIMPSARRRILALERMLKKSS